MARLTHWKQPASNTEEPDNTMDMTFQIPDAGHATQLLNMGDDDFLDGMDDSFGSPQRTPQHHAIAQPPLTLEELTPRKGLKNNLRDALSTKVYAESTPFFKRDKFSPVRRTRAGQDEENVQPPDVLQAAMAAAPAGQSPRSTSPKRTLHAPTCPNAQRLASDDNINSIEPSEKEPIVESVVKSTVPDVSRPASESIEIGQDMTRPEAATVSKAVHSGNPAGPLSIPSAPHVATGTSRARQPARNPSSLRDEAAKAPKPVLAHAARPNRTVATLAKAAPRAPARVRPKAAEHAGSTDEGTKHLQTEAKRAHTAAPQRAVTNADPHPNTATTAAKAEAIGPRGSPSNVSRPSTPPPHDRRASSPLTLSELSPSKQAPPAVQASRPAATTAASAERAPSPEIATAHRPENPVSSAQPEGGQTSERWPAGRALNDSSPSVLPSLPSVPTAGPLKANAKPIVKVLAGKFQAKKQTARRRSSVQRNYCVPSAATKQKSVPRPGTLTAKRRAGLQKQEHTAASARSRDPGLTSSGETKKSTQRLTKPIEFHFKVESRLSARKASDGQDAPGSAAAATRDPSIPDFAARHALEAERVLARKERIAPTVPHSPEFTVEARLRDREKFEEGRRAREAEIEQQRQQLERERLEREEAELRRLRKLAVPKANAVPEWYANAPKKSSRSASSSTSGTS